MLPDGSIITQFSTRFDHANYHQGGGILSRHRFSSRSIKFSRNRLRGPRRATNEPVSPHE